MHIVAYATDHIAAILHPEDTEPDESATAVKRYNRIDYEQISHSYGTTAHYEYKNTQRFSVIEIKTLVSKFDMMTSSSGNIFGVTSLLCGEFTCHRWIPRKKVSDAELWFFFDLRLNKRLSKQSQGWWFETPPRSLWRHCNDTVWYTAESLVGPYSSTQEAVLHLRHFYVTNSPEISKPRGIS